jgi:hypothetical protein
VSRLRRIACRHPTSEGWVRSQLNPYEICDGQDFNPVLVSSASIIPPMLHTHLHLHVALTRRTNGRSLGTFQDAMMFPKLGSNGQKSSFHHSGVPLPEGRADPACRTFRAVNFSIPVITVSLMSLTAAPLPGFLLSLC